MTTTGPTSTTPLFTVFPLRFTDDAPAMIAFLRTLGLERFVTAGDDAFGDLAAGAGRVMVHSVAGAVSGARSGDTDLCLAVPDADVAVAHLERAGVEVSVWDESFGRQGRIDGPAGEGVSLNEDQRDLYGYQGHDASAADPRLAVVAVLPSEDFARDAAHLAHLDLVPVGPAAPGWQELRGPGSAGSIGLHAPMADLPRTRPTSSEYGEALQVRLGFSTTEDLTALADRLTAAGYEARVVEGGGLLAGHVIDPDGVELEIHPHQEG